MCLIEVAGLADTGAAGPALSGCAGTVPRCPMVITTAASADAASTRQRSVAFFLLRVAEGMMDLRRVDRTSGGAIGRDGSQYGSRCRLETESPSRSLPGCPPVRRD